MRPLTPKQQAILDFVGEFSRDHGFAPSLREIGEAVGLTNVSAVRGHVAALEKKGYIAKEADKARSIRFLKPSPFSAFKRKLHEVFRTDHGVIHRVVLALAWPTFRHRPSYFIPP